MPVRSSASSVLRWPEAAEVRAALASWAAVEAARRPALLRLGCFGSFARGEAGVGSDLDLVAVVDATDRRFSERARDWPTERLPVPTDIIVYTLAEWDELQRTGGRFARTLADETIWLVERASEPIEGAG